MAQFIITLGSAGTIEVDSDKFSPAVSAYVFEYGLKQMLNDAHASVTKDVEPDDAKRADAKRGMAQKKLDALLAGMTAAPRTGGTADPIAKLMRSQAEAELVEGVKKAGKKVAEMKKSVDENGNSRWLKAINDLLVKHEPRYRKAAEAALKARNASSAELDLGELGL